MQTRRASLVVAWTAQQRIKALKQALMAWDEYTKSQTVKRQQNSEVIEAKRRRTTLSSVFHAWHAETQVQTFVLTSAFGASQQQHNSAVAVDLFNTQSVKPPTGDV